MKIKIKYETIISNPKYKPSGRPEDGLLPPLIRDSGEGFLVAVAPPEGIATVLKSDGTLVNMCFENIKADTAELQELLKP